MTVIAEDKRIRIERLRLGPWDTNSYILSCRETGDSVIVDAPGAATEVTERTKGTNPRYILMTHDHMDHTGALKELKDKLKIPVAAHSPDANNLGLETEIPLRDGDTISFGNQELRVLHTPGHTPGSVCFWMAEYLISGDTIFPGGPGKTGSPAALKQIIESITNKIFPLPDNTQIFPGHGDSTILKKEKEEFAVFSSRDHDPNLCGDVLWLSS